MKILVTGGLGYIGSIIVHDLLQENHIPIIIDPENRENLLKIQQITNKQVFTIFESISEENLESLFSLQKIDLVIHLAGYKSVSESIKDPLKYYDNNLFSTIALLKQMKKHHVHNLIFSSSATVYGSSSSVEHEPVGRNLLNPYAKSKYFIEEILTDFYTSNPEFNITILRYFNPVGALITERGCLGEKDGENLMPRLLKCLQTNTKLSIFGIDYNTKDGTPVRDFIHVKDLSEGHLACISKMNGLRIYNLGTGVGKTVYEIIKTFNRVNNENLKYDFTSRRPGDISLSVACVEKAALELGWRATRDIRAMCRDAYLFHCNNTVTKEKLD